MKLPSRWSPGWAGLLVLLAVAAYAPVLANGGWIWDDDDYVTENPVLYQDGGLAAIWTDAGATPQYYPVVHTSFWLEVRAWGGGGGPPAPFGMHLDNVLLLGLTGVLFWRLLLLLRVPGAWFAAALFVLHPVHVESAAWVTERKNMLSGVFALATALSFLRYAGVGTRRSENRGLLVLAFLYFVLGVLSKSVIAFVPPALLLLLWWRRPEGWKRPAVLAPLGVLLLIGAVAGWNTARLEVSQVGAEGSYWEHGFIERLLLAGQVCWVYLWHAVNPIGHSFFYPRWEIAVSTWQGWIAPGMAVVLIVAALRSQLRWGRGPLVGLLIFGGALFPVLGFFDVYPMKFSWVADHFQYHADFALYALLGAIAVVATQHLAELPRAVIAGAFLALCATFTALQGGLYQDEESLWTGTTEANPSSWAAWQNLGQLRIEYGDPVEGERLFRHALELQRDPVLLTSLAVLDLQKFGSSRDRSALFEAYHLANEAVTALPIYPKAQAALGHAIVQGGGGDAAAAEAAYQAYFDISFARLPNAQRQAFLDNSETQQVARNLFRLRLNRARAELGAGRGAAALRALAPSAQAWDGAAGRLWRDLQPWSDSSPWLECERLRLWILAAHADEAVRDPQGARREAAAIAASMRQRIGALGAPPVVVVREESRFRDIEAAAAAQAGAFDEALAVAEAALARLGRADRDRLGAAMQARIDLYRAGRPYRFERSPD